MAVAGYRSVLSYCRIVVVADFSYSIVGGEHQSFSVWLTILSHIITPHANQSNDRFLPFERVIPLEMTEIFFFLFASQTGATSDGLPIERFDFASFFFFFLVSVRKRE